MSHTSSVEVNVMYDGTIIINSYNPKKIHQVGILLKLCIINCQTVLIVLDEIGFNK